MAEVISGDLLPASVSFCRFSPLGSRGSELAAVPPALGWVRLTQRFSVRIILDKTTNRNLQRGLAATVRIDLTQRVAFAEDGILQS